MKKRFVVLIASKDPNSEGAFSPGLFLTLRQARGWAKERMEFNAAHGFPQVKCLIAELVPREMVEWEGGEA